MPEPIDVQVIRWYYLPMIKTNITVKRLRKLNPWIKTDAQARKIIKTVKSAPSLSLEQVIRNNNGNINGEG